MNWLVVTLIGLASALGWIEDWTMCVGGISQGVPWNVACGWEPPGASEG